jgi:hypothetical protein
MFAVVSRHYVVNLFHLLILLEEVFLSLGRVTLDPRSVALFFLDSVSAFFGRWSEN